MLHQFIAQPSDLRALEGVQEGESLGAQSMGLCSGSGICNDKRESRDTVMH